MKEDRLQQSSWLNEDKCKYLQNRWGDYDSFRTNPNKENKLPIMDELDFLVDMYDGQAEVLEVGCGSGHFMWVLRKKVKKLIGLDYSASMLKLLEEQFASEKYRSDYIAPEMELVEGSCWDMPFEDNYADIVFQVDVCMHIGGSWDAIKEMIRVSRKFVLFTGPSFEQFDNVMNKRIDKKSFAVSVPLLEKELNRLKVEGEIESFRYLDRPRTKMYNHRILEVMK